MGDPKTCASLFNSTAGNEALTWEKSLIYTYHVAPEAPSTGENVAQFGAGKVGMLIIGEGGVPSFLSALGPATLGEAPLPEIGHNRDDFLGQGFYFVFKKSDTTPDKLKGIGLFLGALYKQNSVVGTNAGLISAYLPALKDPGVKKNEYYKAAFAGVKNGRLNPAIPNWGTITGVPLYDNVQNALLNRQSIPSALAQAQRQTDQLTSTLPGCSK